MKDDGQHLIGRQIDFRRTLAPTIVSPPRLQHRWKKSGIILLSLCLTLAAMGQSLTDILTGRVQTRGIVISLYDPGQLKPSVIVKAERVYTDYERRGFFRLGILPLGVMENVVFEICGSTTNQLTQLHEWIGAPAAKRLEFRNVTFLAAGGCTNRLECGRAKIGAAGRWELSDGVRFLSGTNQIKAIRATLQVTGEQAGQIDLASTPSGRANLFAPNRLQTTLPKDTP